MKKLFAAIVATVAAMMLMSAAVSLFVIVAIRVSKIGNPGLRSVAVAAESCCGVLWLLGTVFVATHLAVRIVARVNGVNGE